MNICGIVCEYNPFHNGHAYLISEVRQRLGADTGVICAMSGDFVQRGEAAVFDKHDRARAAVLGGADLVLELPLPWSISSAEGFARGAVGLLGATGLVTHLAFGSESGDAELLRELAALLTEPETDLLIREELSTGISYAAARQKALEKRCGHAVPQLASPNDILAVEYLKAVRMQNLALTPIAVRRIGAAHDSDEEAAYPSASLLRQKLRAGEDVSSFLPAEVWSALRAGCGPADPERIETALLSRLRFLPEQAFAELPDAGEGLYHRIFRAAHTEPTLEAVLDAAASKRYPRARLRRICLCAALGVKAGDNAGIPPYLRVLAANARGLMLLRKMEETCALPVVTKPGKVRGLDTACQTLFELCAAGSDFYHLGFCEQSARRGDRDWKTGPAIVK